jgi:hypothetical protein
MQPSHGFPCPAKLLDLYLKGQKQVKEEETILGEV